MLEVMDVRKRFGGLVAVDGVSFEIGEGEIVGLIGPNGAGKTTLFNVITGVLRPEPGSTIRFAGQDLTSIDQHDIARCGIARTFQIVRTFDEMTVLENTVTGALFGTGESLSRAEAEDRGRAALAFIGLADRADVKANTLPLAQKKQLEVARALASDPKLVLLDEIASGLTPREIGRLSETVDRMRTERGIAVFWIEHIMEAIMEVADRVIVLNSGRKIAEGTPAAIRANETVIEAYLGEEA